MPAAFAHLAETLHGRAVRRSLLLVSIAALLAAGSCLHELHKLSRIADRRLAHSVLFAGRPRVRVAAHGAGTPTPSVALLPAGYSRSLRRVPAYDALPPQLVQAVISIEDRRFFQHSGIDYTRTAACAAEDAFHFHITCGGSTLTQQLARVDFLSQRQTLRRKVLELLIAHRLEQRLTKQQIFAMYADRINLGQQGPQPILGLRRAARVYFGQDLARLDLAQIALLAGMIHAPNFDNPYRHPERALHRRNVVLDAMVTTGAISQAEADQAKAEPLRLSDLLLPVLPMDLSASQGRTAAISGPLRLPPLHLFPVTAQPGT